MPEVFYTKMKWEYDYSTYTPGTTFGSRTIYGNGLYLVDATASTTLQPYGFNDMGNIYNKYTVLGCRIQFRVENVTASTGLEACLVANTSSTSYSSFQDASNDPRASKIKTTAGRTDGGGMIMYLQQYQSTAAVEGLSNNNLIDLPQYAGSGSANPSEVWYYTLYLNSTSSGTVISCRVKCSAVFYVKYFNRDKSTEPTPP